MRVRGRPTAFWSMMLTSAVMIFVSRSRWIRRATAATDRPTSSAISRCGLVLSRWSVRRILLSAASSEGLVIVDTAPRILCVPWPKNEHKLRSSCNIQSSRRRSGIAGLYAGSNSHQRKQWRRPPEGEGIVTQLSTDEFGIDISDNNPNSGLVAFYKDMTTQERRTFWGCWTGWALDVGRRNGYGDLAGLARGRRPCCNGDVASVSRRRLVGRFACRSHRACQDATIDDPLVFVVLVALCFCSEFRTVAGRSSTPWVWLRRRVGRRRRLDG